MPGDAGQQVEPGVRMHREIDLARPQGHRVRGCQRERGPAEFNRVDAQQQVVHHRVADEDALENVGGGDPGLRGDLADQGVDRLAHRLGHLDRPAGVHQRIRDPAHQVLAEADLRVHQAGRRLDLAAGQVAEMAGDGGRADVEGGAVERALVIARPDLHDPRRDAPPIIGAVVIDRDRDLPLAVAQRRLQPLHGAQVADHAGQRPLLGQRRDQALQIARRLVHVGLGDLDVVEPGGRIHDDLARLGAFAHDLLVDLALGGHVDHHVALDPGLAAEPAALDQAAFRIVALLDLVPRAQRVLAHRDAVLGELAEGRGDLAFRADAAPAADRVEIDAEGARGGQDRGAGGKPAPLARRGEDHQGVARGVGHAALRPLARREARAVTLHEDNRGRMQGNCRAAACDGVKAAARCRKSRLRMGSLKNRPAGYIESP